MNPKKEGYMQTIHLRADEQVMEKIIALIDQFAREGKEIEILDNTLHDEEHRMIQKALAQEAGGETQEHEKLWHELLK